MSSTTFWACVALVAAGLTLIGINIENANVHWRVLGASVSLAACVVSLVVLAVSAVTDNGGWMLGSSAVFVGSICAYLWLVGPAVGAND